MTINSDTFISDIILFLRNMLRTGISHPDGATNEFIFTSFPKRATTYPMITIKNAGLTVSPLGMYSEVALANLNIEVRVWSKNSKHADTLTQEIIELFRGLQYGTDSTTTEQIFDFRLLSCVPIVEEDNDITIHSKVLTFNYQCILGDE